MLLKKMALGLAAPVALLGLAGCATGFPAQVQRFQALPAPQGQTFIIQAADAENRGGLEFGRYAGLVRQHLIQQGFTEAGPGQGASLIVTLDYGVDNGRERIVSSPGFGYSGFYRPRFSRFGYFGGRRHPFYWGWHDPFWGDPFGHDVRSYTVYTSFLDMDIRRAGDGQAVFEGLAQAQSRTDDLPVLVPNLIEAMFTGFPGNNGERVRITVPDGPRAPRY
ncbi:DUF4136 domain-containing protein [Sphingosinicella sp. YJ22]|uniref:DUF4136 domain-containing protein n=1 Tax=Sphingosinicella sp. YJ22 TaxID=1104780 RepID=UPI00140744CE|nr:DUF4136 domain-containing protein [Sphingosinicella sp. YJ22]